MGVKQGQRSHKTPPMKRPKWQIILIATVITALSLLTYKYINQHDNEAKLQIQLQSKSAQLEEQIKQLDKSQTDSKALQQQLKDTKAQLEAKAKKDAQNKAYAATVNQAVPTVSDAQAKAFIYSHESGNRTNAVNSIGACGLGQALPCSKMPCTLQDYACQDSFFTQYMINRYGTWQIAYQFWLNHSWW